MDKFVFSADYPAAMYTAGGKTAARFDIHKIELHAPVLTFEDVTTTAPPPPPPLYVNPNVVAASSSSPFQEPPLMVASSSSSTTTSASSSSLDAFYCPEFLQYSEETFRDQPKPKKQRQEEISNTEGLSTAEMRRQIHIQSEQKRRAQIKDGFEDLRNELPACLNKKMSKVALLHKSKFLFLIFCFNVKEKALRMMMVI